MAVQLGADLAIKSLVTVSGPYTIQQTIINAIVVEVCERRLLASAAPLSCGKQQSRFLSKHAGCT
jgi:hypothetical protein